MRRIVELAAVLVLVAVVIQPQVHATSRGGAFDAGTQSARSLCPTEQVWAAKAVELGLHGKSASCPLEGACDDPAVRDDALAGAFTVRIVVHVMRNAAGVAPGVVDTAAIDDQIALLNQHYAPYAIDFDLVDVQYHDDDAYDCIAPLSFFNDDYLLDIQGMKDTYATGWTQALNIFVGCQESSFFGVLGGLAVFPWDPDALTPRGGLWMNADYFGAGQTVLTHEVGHCLGLWHPHRGVSETFDCNDPCSENVHAVDDPFSDTVGDFCKDTPATPANGVCADPDGTDCNAVTWSGTDFANYMGYADETCVDHFTPEQGQRMHCWARDGIASVLDDHVLQAHVVSVQVTSESMGGARRRGIGRVHVAGSDGLPASGVTVTGHWSDSYEGIVTATTNASGEVTFLTPWIKSPVYCWSLHVLELSGVNVVHDKSADLITGASVGKGCNGGPIVVETPFSRVAPFFDGTGPNPFNPATVIRFRLPVDAPVRLSVIDLAGREVTRLVDEHLRAGAHEISWRALDDHGRRVASGVYHAVLRTPTGSVTQRLVLLK